MNETDPKKTKTRDLLIVDDDAVTLMALEKTFSKYYNVKTAKNGKLALETVQKGFRPGVILTDQQMPEMTGSEFLEQTLKIIPDTIRILLTSHSQQEEIIPSMTQGKAYMYISKPYQELQILQAIRNGFNYYDTFQKNKYLNKQLNSALSKFKQVKDNIGASKQPSRKDITATFAGIFNLHEKFYFYYRYQAIDAIMVSMAKELQLDNQNTDKLVTAARLINAMNITMPEKYRLQSPDELNEDQRKEYFKYFNKSLKILASDKNFEDIAQILSNIWERADGSGYPNAKKGSDISPFSQIIAIANIFHNQVYRIYPDKYDKLVSEGLLEQPQFETKERHTEATKHIFRNQKWFSNEVFEAFKNVLNGKKCHALVPKRGVLKCRYSIINIEKEEEESPLAGPEQIEAQIGDGDIKYFEKEILVQDLKPGMINASDVISTKGMLIVRREQKLPEAIVNNIKQLESVGMLNETIKILEPDWSGDD